VNVNNLPKTSNSSLSVWADNLLDRSLNWKVHFIGSLKQITFSDFSSSRMNNGPMCMNMNHVLHHL
jgi:hypothetical protein